MLQNYFIFNKAAVSVEIILRAIWFLDVFSFSEYKLRHSAKILEERFKSTTALEFDTAVNRSSEISKKLGSAVF